MMKEKPMTEALGALRVRGSVLPGDAITYSVLYDDPLDPISGNRLARRTEASQRRRAGAATTIEHVRIPFAPGITMTFAEGSVVEHDVPTATKISL